MGQGRRDKKTFEINPEGCSRNGKHRLRWLENVKQYLREMSFK
jgi:hypothetical protein